MTSEAASSSPTTSKTKEDNITTTTTTTSPSRLQAGEVGAPPNTTAAVGGQPSSIDKKTSGSPERLHNDRGTSRGPPPLPLSVNSFLTSPSTSELNQLALFIHSKICRGPTKTTYTRKAMVSWGTKILRHWWATTDTEGYMTIETCKLFEHFTTHTEK